MKKITLFLTILTFFFLKLSAQDWHVVDISKFNYYFPGSSDTIRNHATNYLMYMNVNNKSVENLDSVYYYYTRAQVLYPPYFNSNFQEKYCVDTNLQTWLGEKSIRKNNGDELFFFNDTIIIKTKALINQSWLMFKSEFDSLEVYATVIETGVELIDGNLDSTKKIVLSTLKNGNIFSHILNNKSIILTKNNGFKRFFTIQDFVMPSLTAQNYIHRIDKSKHTKTALDVVSDVNEQYSTGNSWAYTFDYIYMFGSNTNLQGYKYDSVINDQMISSTQKKVTIKTIEKKVDVFPTEFSTRIFDTIIDFSLITSFDLYSLTNFENMLYYDGLNINNYNTKYYWTYFTENTCFLASGDDGFQFYTIDSCLTYTKQVGLGYSSSFARFEYDLRFGTTGSYHEDYAPGNGGPYMQYGSNLVYYKLGNTIFGEFSLPISNIEVQVVSNPNNIYIVSWQTTEELNVDHFEIERSFNLIDFTKIGDVKSLGNSTAKQQYIFEDNVKNYASSKYAYRIKSVDIDGKYQYSNIVSLQKITDESFSIYPNPFKDNINIDINSKSETNYTIQLSNAVGVIVKKFAGNLVSGNNKIQINDLGNLAKGIYYLQFSVDEKETKTYKLIKQ